MSTLLALGLFCFGVSISRPITKAQSQDGLLTRLANLDVAEEVKVIGEATKLSPAQKRDLQSIFSKTQSLARQSQSAERPSEDRSSGMELLTQLDDELHAVLDCEQREVYRKYRRDKRWTHLQHKQSRGEPVPRMRWSPSDAKARLEAMHATLKLSDAQKAQVDGVYADAEAQWQTVNALQDKAQRQRYVDELHFHTQDQIYAVLSCSQREALRKAKQEQSVERRERRRTRD